MNPPELELSKTNAEIEQLKTALQKAENEAVFYKLIANKTSDWEILRDSTGRIIFVNEAFETITGYKSIDILNGSITERDIVHPDDWDKTAQSIKKSINCEPVYDLEFRIIRKDDIIRTINLNAVPVYEKGTFFGTRTSARDISNQKNFQELKQLHDSLVSAQDRFYTFVNSAPVAIFLADENGHYSYVNPSASDMLGYSSAELLLKSIHEILPPENRETDYQNFIDLKQFGETHDFKTTLIKKNGEQLPILLDGLKLSENEYIAYVKDISKQVEFEDFLKKQNKEYLALNEEYKSSIEELLRAKDELLSSQLRLKEAQRLSKMGHWELNLSENTLLWSDEIYRIFGANPQEFGATYEAFLNYIHPDDRELVNSAYQNHLKNQATYMIEHRIVLPDGQTKYVVERCESDFDETGKATRSFGSVADITEQKLTEVELQKAKLKAEESDKLKTAFLQNVSHEIRTPMNAISGFAQLLQHQNLSDDKKQNYITIIQNSTRQLLSIIEDVLTISNIETKQVQINIHSVNINNLLVELLTTFSAQAADKNILLYIHKGLSDINSEVFADRSKLTQILTNLITNSLKFTFTGQISYGYEKITVNNKEQLRFFVKDTGIGIVVSAHRRIFERFTHADEEIGATYGGTGLGLSICKGYVELLGGDIWLESEPDRCTTFYFTIDYEPVSSEIKNTPEHLQTVLIAEDEVYNFMLLEELLSKTNMQVLHAKTGKQAIELLEKKSNISLIIMDIKMPEMDGKTAARIIREKYPDKHIIAISAYTNQAEMRDNKTLFDDTLAKPIVHKTLLSVLRKYIPEL